MATTQIIAHAYTQPATQCIYITAHLKFEIRVKGEVIGRLLPEVPTLAQVLQFVE